MELEQKIAAYLSGDLEGEALAAFQRELEEDPTLQKEVQAYQEVDAFLGEGNWPDSASEKDRMDYAEALQRLQANGVPDKIDQVFNDPAKRTFPYWTAIAASVSVVLLGFIWFYLRPAASPQELYLSYYDPTELPSFTERGTSEEDEIVRLYKAGAYNQFVESVSSVDDIKMELRLYYGVSLLETGQEEQAKEVFARYANSTLLDAPKGYWYLGLTYLKQGNTAKALDSFAQLQQSGTNFKRTETEELIGELE